MTSRSSRLFAEAGIRATAAVLTIVALSISLFGAEGNKAAKPQLRATISSGDGTLVGEQVTMVVEILAPGTFATSPSFDLPQVPGVLIMPPSGSPLITNEEQDGTAFAVQRHELALLARSIGKHEIPPFHVRFSYKRSPLDKQTTTVDELTPALTLTAQMPPSVKNLNGLLCANNIELHETWQPRPGPAKIGSAFTRTIEYSADGITGMAFSPFPAGAIDGIRIYRTAPEVSDGSNRGEITGKRRETITYVCEQPGHFVIPAVQLTWWNLDQKKLETIKLAHQAITVADNAVGSTGKSYPVGGRWPRFNLAPFTAAVGLMGLIFLAARFHTFQSIGRYFAPNRLVTLNPDSARAIRD